MVSDVVLCVLGHFFVKHMLLGSYACSFETREEFVIGCNHFVVVLALRGFY